MGNVAFLLIYCYDYNNRNQKDFQGENGKMKILFIKSSHIRIAGMACALDRLGHEIVEYPEAGEEIVED